jgi:polyisoprenoid-binding protein YceI
MSTPKTRVNDRSGETISGRWRLDPARSSVEFRVPHFWGLITVKGHFDDYEGQLDLSTEPAIELTIEAASLQTGNPKRDKHLRSSDFFDAENHPRVGFRAESVDLQPDRLKVRGLLSAHGRAIPLELDAQLHRVDGEFEIEAAATARHRVLGMTWSPLGMIRPRSELVVKGRLIPGSERPSSRSTPAQGRVIGQQGAPGFRQRSRAPRQ